MVILPSVYISTSAPFNTTASVGNKRFGAVLHAEKNKWLKGGPRAFADFSAEFSAEFSVERKPEDSFFLGAIARRLLDLRSIGVSVRPISKPE